ncbi:MAG: phosphotransferase [Bacteroidota bacterium]
MEDLHKRFSERYPQSFFLDVSRPNELEGYLRALNWIRPEDSIQKLEKPGEGNMNCVYRVKTTKGSFIVKQARPWVEKYPQIPAPVNRAGVEATFLGIVNETLPLQSLSPQLLGFDPNSFFLALEDLGAGTDYTFLYQRNGLLESTEIEQLTRYLDVLHAFSTQQNIAFPHNKDMRVLNHEHIFRFPFEEQNGFDLDTLQPGLQAASLPYKRAKDLKEKVNLLGEVYLSTGKTLLHGDFYPGSWLKVDQGIRIIDPEFSFLGPAEFDLAIFFAHMMLAQQGQEQLITIAQAYPRFGQLNARLLAGFAGTEILRRLIGIAQLPLEMEIDEKKELMQVAANWILEGKISEIA